MSFMKKIGVTFFVIMAVLMYLVGCSHVVDGPGMVNTEYDQGY